MHPLILSVAGTDRWKPVLSQAHTHTHGKSARLTVRSLCALCASAHGEREKKSGRRTHEFSTHSTWQDPLPRGGGTCSKPTRLDSHRKGRAGPPGSPSPPPRSLRCRSRCVCVWRKRVDRQGSESAPPRSSSRDERGWIGSRGGGKGGGRPGNCPNPRFVRVCSVGSRSQQGATPAIGTRRKAWEGIVQYSTDSVLCQMASALLNGKHLQWDGHAARKVQRVAGVVARGGGGMACDRVDG